jgi:hypothetical protein
MADKDTSSEATTTPTDEEVETTDTSVTEEDETSQEDQDGASEDEDESNDDADDSNDDDDSEDEDDSDDDDSEEDEDEPEFKKAFSQIKGDTAQEYIPNLEEAYRKSSAEGKRLSGEKKDLQDRLDQINAAVAKNPELAKLIMEATGDEATPPTVDPGVLKARQDYEEDVAKKLDTFLADHQTLADDETLMEEFMDNLATIGAKARKQGKILDPAVAYKRALGMMDYDDSKDKLVDAAKSTASKPKTPAAKKTVSKSDKPKLTPEQIAYGKKFGLTEKDLLATLNK